MNRIKRAWTICSLLLFCVLAWHPISGCASSKEGISAWEKLQVEQDAEKSFKDLQEQEQQHNN